MKSSLVLAALATMLMSGLAQAQIAFTGDMLFRTEQIKDETGTTAPVYTTDRLRERLRLRLKADAKINDVTTATFRIATGTTASTATMSRVNDLGGSTNLYNTGNPIILDWAFFNYKATDMVTLIVGKMSNPYYQVNDVVFDTDIAPEGVAMTYKNNVNGTDIFFNAGMSWLQENAGSTATAAKDDVQLVAAQLGADFKADAYNVKVIASSYTFNSIQGSAIQGTAASGLVYGNSTSGGVYTYGYKLTSIALEAGTKVSDMPFVFFADSITNGATDVSNNKTATTFGIKLNKLKEKGSWAFYLDSREVQADSVFGLFTDGDSSGGGANVSSLRARFGYQLGDNSQLWVNYLDGKKSIATTATAAGSVAGPDLSTKANRMQLDFAMNF